MTKVIGYNKFNIIIKLWNKLLNLVETYNLSDRKTSIYKMNSNIHYR